MAHDLNLHEQVNFPFIGRQVNMLDGNAFARFFMSSEEHRAASAGSQFGSDFVRRLERIRIAELAHLLQRLGVGVVRDVPESSHGWVYVADD